MARRKASRRLTLPLQFELRCDGCPDNPPIEVHDSLKSDGHNQSWGCERCFYVHPDPAQDPFYQDQVKILMYICAVILVLVRMLCLNSRAFADVNCRPTS